MIVSEFGGISLTPADTQDWYGYGTVADTAMFREKFAELVGALLACPDIAGFCYTQLTDIEQETNGLLDASRQPKIPLSEIREIVTKPAAAIANEAAF